MSKQEFRLLCLAFVLAAAAVMLGLLGLAIDGLQSLRIDQLEWKYRPEPMTEASFVVASDLKWTPMNGDWVVTYYDDKFLGRNHGAYYRDMTIRNYAGRGLMPDVVNETHHGVAMTSHLYGFPVKICVRVRNPYYTERRCAVGTVIDEPRDRIIVKGSKVYNHVDVWPGMIDDLGIGDKGIVYGVEVYLGVDHSLTPNLYSPIGIAKVSHGKP